jgi:nucleoside-diphosphate-sugar epimerase
MSIYLITGIAGFIGSSIARELVRRGETVRGIDNFSTGKPENLASISRAIDFRKVDLLDMRGVVEACEGIDYVIHQAAIPSVPRSIADPLSCNDSNVDGTLNLLVAARDAAVRRVVYVMLAFLYVWLSSGSPETTGQSLHLSPAKMKVLSL